MKLAEALAARADTQRRIQRLQNRIANNARYQEGEPPAEDASALLSEAVEACAELEELIRRINRTNASTPLGSGTVTDALARRDVLRIQYNLLTAAADAAAGKDGHYGRQLRSELPYVSALDVRGLRERADRVARELREVDLAIQKVNWEAELAD
ncbi:DIP1984 family protein [Saccharomonospora glauca]|jgi:hypothetical protein|uniref:Septicolysin n=1 Tax=Saccharomonospora glauca K62 TaxID=928724 RepID=I1D277_9PSEU|nr:DIP1984 family protein [Saccharomonospora glauca]EIE99051.1 hypothetical protein SacglDRAFT_02150 [Saccharomonospora glauca K62]